MNELEESVRLKDVKIKELEERLTFVLQENRSVIETKQRGFSRGRTFASSSSVDVDIPPSPNTQNTSSHIAFDKDTTRLPSRKQSASISQSGALSKVVKCNENGVDEISSQACVVM